MIKEGKFSFRNNKAQITIFIILAMIIVAGVLIYFLVISPVITGPGKTTKVGIDKCIDDSVTKAIASLGSTAGYINPKFYASYNSEKFVFLCYTNLYYKPCVNQQPLLKQFFEQQILEQTKQEIYSCYDNLVSEYQKQGYEVTNSKKDLRINLEPGQVKVELDAPLTLSRDSTQKFTTLKSSVNSHVYEILMLATSIIQFETTYGDSDINTLMAYYPDYTINKIRRDDGTLYTIEDKTTKTKFQFASRSYAWPVGYGTTNNLVY